MLNKNHANAKILTRPLLGKLRRSSPFSPKSVCTLFRRLAIPLCRLNFVFYYASAVFIDMTALTPFPSLPCQCRFHFWHCRFSKRRAADGLVCAVSPISAMEHFDFFMYHTAFGHGAFRFLHGASFRRSWNLLSFDRLVSGIDRRVSPVNRLINVIIFTHH